MSDQHQFTALIDHRRRRRLYPRDIVGLELRREFTLQVEEDIDVEVGDMMERAAGLRVSPLSPSDEQSVVDPPASDSYCFEV